MQFVTGVTAVYRYNPGIIAQAFASLDVLHPGRISFGVGSEEAMNEVPLGQTSALVDRLYDQDSFDLIHQGDEIPRPILCQSIVLLLSHLLLCLEHSI